MTTRHGRTYWPEHPAILNGPFRRSEIGLPLAIKIAGFQIVAGIFLSFVIPYLRRTLQRQARHDVELATNGVAAVGVIVEYRPRFFKVRYRFSVLHPRR